MSFCFSGLFRSLGRIFNKAHDWSCLATATGEQTKHCFVALFLWLSRTQLYPARTQNCRQRKHHVIWAVRQSEHWSQLDRIPSLNTKARIEYELAVILTVTPQLLSITFSTACGPKMKWRILSIPEAAIHSPQSAAQTKSITALHHPKRVSRVQSLSTTMVQERSQCPSTSCLQRDSVTIHDRRLRLILNLWWPKEGYMDEE